MLLENPKSSQTCTSLQEVIRLATAPLHAPVVGANCNPRGSQSIQQCPMVSLTGTGDVPRSVSLALDIGAGSFPQQ